MAVQAVSIVRWLARIIASLLFLGLLTFAIGEGFGGEGFPNPVKLTLIENVLLVGMLLIAAGLMLGWKWEIFGGLTNLIGVGTFWITELIVSYKIQPADWAFFILAIPGFLYLYCGTRSTR